MIRERYVDDLVGVLAQRRTDMPQQPMGYRQGEIRAFDAVTGANTVKVDGQDYIDLPILGIADAQTFRPGSIVGIVTVGGTWCILGRFVVPASAAWNESLGLLSSRITSTTVATNNTTNSTSYVDLGTTGPAVTASIGPSGRALVLVTAELAITTVGNGALMSFAISGATTAAAVDTRALAVSPSGTGAWMMTRAVLVEGLTAGSNTFTAKYRSVVTGSTVAFQNRNLTVFAL